MSRPEFLRLVHAFADKGDAAFTDAEVNAMWFRMIERQDRDRRVFEAVRANYEEWLIEVAAGIIKVAKAGDDRSVT